MRRVIGCVVLALACGSSLPSGAAERNLTFEDRVLAQEAIERTRYRHQIGAVVPFEQAVPRTLLEDKVRNYLDETAALERYWNTTVTDATLQRELERIASGTRMPERLQELYAALGNDPFLVKECLARATLVDRLARDFYAFDARLHAGPRTRADALHRQLASRILSPLTNVSERFVVRVSASDADRDGPNVRAVSDDQFKELRSRLPLVVDRVSTIEEDRDAFEFSVLLDESPHDMHVASYTIRKTPWDEWWAVARLALQGGPVRPVALVDSPLPTISAKASRIPESGCATDDTWGAIADRPNPAPRYLHTAVWTGSVMIVWGGIGPSTLKSGGRYDPVIDSWTPTSTTGAPTARSLHSAVWTGQQMVVWGGRMSSSIYFDTGGRYDPIADTWLPTSTIGAPSPRGSHGAVWTGGLMLVWGGADNTVSFQSGGRYDPLIDTWTPMTIIGAPSARSNFTAIWTGSVMVVWGSTATNSGGRYDPVADVWTPTATIGAPSARSAATAVWTGSRMIVWGGSNLDNGGLYDPVMDTWSPTSTVGAPSARQRHQAVWTGSAMIVWGGTIPDPSGWAYVTTGGRYDPLTDSWTSTSTVGSPPPGYRHTSVWTGELMIVWGGNNYNFSDDTDYYFDTGARYDPSTDTWTPVSGGATPRARVEHVAVWTGNVMVLWGGVDATGVGMNTGGRYDPTTDSWSPTTTTGAPAGRRFHTGVWTGNSLIVWGGLLSAPLVNPRSGGKYDPVADTWSPTSLVGVPTGRYFHSAVWTGSEMLIWGGSADLNTGARYNPNSDTWAGMSTVGAPPGRERLSAVWTGTSMIVWGGDNRLDSYTTLGGRYDPVTNTWAPTSSSGAPVGRVDASAVWTGTLFVVWGGYRCDAGGNCYRLDTGGRYDPVTDTWNATSQLGAPSARTTEAVWTGDVMVVWGGFGTADLNTGGRYNPTTDFWTPTSTFGVPGVRDRNAAVWIGDSMLVWGGYSDQLGAYLTSGGRYFVSTPTDDDGDGTPNACDDCPATFDPMQTDGDDDGEGDLCDMDDGLIYVFGSSDNALSWQPEAGSTSWNVYKGDLAVLRSTGTYTQAPGSNSQAARLCGLSSPSAVDTDTPPVGSVTYHLVTGVASGIESSLGVDSAGSPRTNSSPCP